MKTLAQIDKKIKAGKATREEIATAIGMRVSAMRKPMPCPVCGVDRCNILAHHDKQN
jgi:hypothetical protein